jgi:hypothetical protein
VRPFFKIEQGITRQSNAFRFVTVDAAKQKDWSLARKIGQTLGCEKWDGRAQSGFFPTLEVMHCGQKVLRNLSQ